MSSRVIVKNLPAYLTDDKLKAHFSQKGNVTDVKLKKTRDGRSRRFGFVGFKTEEEAQAAVDFFNDSFLDTSRLVVELAKTLDDPSLISRQDRRARDKRRLEHEIQLEQQNSKKSKHGNENERPSVIPDGLENNPKFAQFVDAFENTKNKNKKRTWENQDVDTVTMEKEAQRAAAAAAAEAESDDEYVNVIRTDATGEQASDEEPMMSLSGPAPAPANNDEEDEPMMPLNEVQDGLARDQNISDMDWLQMRRLRMKEQQENEEEAAKHQPSKQRSERGPATTNDLKNENTSYRTRAIPQRPELPDPNEIARNKIQETGRLFIRNVLFTSSEEDFKTLFSTVGPVEEVHIPVNPKTGASKGLVYVMFSDPNDAVAAFDKYNRQFFQGRILHIVPGEPKKSAVKRLDEYDLKNMPLKRQNELKRKFAASQQNFAWNSLYLNSDAVMETVAKKLGVQKSDLLNPESSDAAVQQALAETSVLNSIRQYFEENGVDLTTFGQIKDKSDHVILVKNLPFDTSVSELTNLFAEFGELRKVLMPPDGGIALIVFKTAPQARAAFTKLAYRRFKSSILYLEKGPKGLFESELDSTATAGQQQSVVSDQNIKDAKISAAEVFGTMDDEATAAAGPSTLPTTSIFVKNLNFKTSTADLQSLFKTLDGYVVAQVKMKPDPKNAAKQQSMGFGFVEFDSNENAVKAVKAMNGHVLQDHRLQIKISTRGQDSIDGSTVASTKAGDKTKILIRNIPFEATRKDIQKLLSSFGQLRSVRLPKKFNKSARGFAFAEFVTAKEAANALKALQGTHLLGRKLVMEYASDETGDAEDEISKMESKVKKQVTAQALAGYRLGGQQKDMDMDEEME